MNQARALTLQLAALARIKDAYGEARSFRSHADTLHEKTTFILTELRMKRAPRHIVSYVDGYANALRDQLYRDALMFGAIIDGEFYSHDRTRADSVDARGLSYCDFSALLKTPGAVVGHYWKHGAGIRPFHESPAD